MLPSSLVACAIALFFPLALEIDYGVIAKGMQAAGKTHRLRIVITASSGDGVDSNGEFGRTVDPEYLRWELASDLRFMKKWSFYQKGSGLVILSYDGSPVKKVEIMSNGPKPTVRWIPNPKLKK